MMLIAFCMLPGGFDPWISLLRSWAIGAASIRTGKVGCFFFFFKGRQEVG